MIMDIQVYELRVPPKADKIVKSLIPLLGCTGALTCIINYPSLCPMFDYHSQGPHSRIDLNIGLNHPSVLQSHCIVDVHVACNIELWIQDLDNRDFGCGHADNLLHTAWWAISILLLFCKRSSLLFARRSAILQTPSNSFQSVVMHTSTVDIVSILAPCRPLPTNHPIHLWKGDCPLIQTHAPECHGPAIHR